MQLTAERKKEIFKKFGGNEANTGSTEAQVALITSRIEHMTEHLKKNKKDFSTLRSLNNLVSQRKKFLKYLSERDITKYRALIKELGLRR